ncbi:phage scaffolding protein [Staphylococcus capitis]|uniref:phage scaffolding protein n=2 Tax=Staphylococcus capitis TaxID=29388 RepID=UPI0011A603C0|nr:phage scaffolding protein [Staphylococcus capitis]
MAFSREELKNIGIDDEKINDVMTLYGKNIQSLKDSVDEEKRKAEENKKEVESYRKRINEQNDELDNLKEKINKGENLEEQINALKQANKEKDQQHIDEMNEVKLQYEIDKELNSAGAKNTTAVMALVNRDNISFDSEKGSRGLKEQLDDLKEMKVIYSYKITMNYLERTKNKEVKPYEFKTESN